MQYPGSLHNHTDFSNFRLRDSINSIDSIIDKAIELNHKAIAITEHECVSNAIKIEKYYDKIKKTNPDFKVIRGNEIYLCRDGLCKETYITKVDRFYHFVLLAKDAIGHQQIRELSSRAWSRAWKLGKTVRVPTYYSDIEEIIGNNKGHVIGSTACLGGYLPSMVMEEAETIDIIAWCRRMQEIFGKDDFYLEMQPAKNKDQVTVNRFLKDLSDELDIKYIITTDSHYLTKKEAPIHSAFLKAQEGEREVDAFYESTYMMSTDELEELMSYSFVDKETIYKAYETIEEIIEKCQDYSLRKSLKIPSLKWVIPKLEEIEPIWFERMPMLETFYNSSFDGDRVLALAVVNKILSDKRLQDKKIYNELDSNLRITWESSNVNKAHWSAYFLNLQNVIEQCWNAGTLVGPGRGSGVGFLLLYILDIVQINPLWEKTPCFAWRFLNPERVSVLDVDVDISGNMRATVLEYLREYYGRDRVANVVTFGTEKPRSAIQTAARGLGIDNDVAAYISSLVPNDRGKDRTLHQCYYGDKEQGFEPVHPFVASMNEYPELWKVAKKIEGLICRVGEHAGGVILVDEPFTNSTALMKVPNGDVVTQFDLHDCEDVSLIKLDLLSINGLDKIQSALDLLIQDGRIKPEKTLKETYEKVIGIYNLERDNAEMWDMVKDHKILSLFQMEQQSGIQGISLINPRSVDELAVLNSVIRLMAPEKGAEQPLNMWARYRKDRKQWINEMKEYGLTAEEIAWLDSHSAITDGICESQEGKE